MNQEQKDIIAGLTKRLIDGNDLLVQSLERLRPSDQRDFLPKIQEQINNTKELIGKVKSTTQNT